MLAEKKTLFLPWISDGQSGFQQPGKSGCILQKKNYLFGSPVMDEKYSFFCGPLCQSLAGVKALAQCWA